MESRYITHVNVCTDSQECEGEKEKGKEERWVGAWFRESKIWKSRNKETKTDTLTEQNKTKKKKNKETCEW